MSKPSSLPSAGSLTEKLRQQYLILHSSDLTERVRETLEVPQDDDLKLEHIARWARETNQFTSFFLNTVTSADFFTHHNRGHSAVADLLLATAARSVISTNVDYLIEKAAQELGRTDFEAVVRQSEINRQRDYSDLVKLHGCLRIDREHTVWCKNQVKEDETVEDRISRLRQWMAGNLMGSDLLIVGYWSDWPHITETFVESIRDIEPPAVYLVDLAASDCLRAKAPGLAEWVEGDEVDFYYLQVGAVRLLDELRRRFSLSFCRQIVATAHQRIEEFYGETEVSTPFLESFDELSTDQLYELRRDYAGVPNTVPAPHARPDAAYYDRMGALHHVLFERGATLDGRFYNIDGELFRLVNSNNRPVLRVQGDFEDEEPVRGLRAYVCVGGDRIPGRPNVAGENEGDEVVRIAGAVEWWSEDEFRRYLDEVD